MPGRIPDRWEAYKPLGKPINGTRFITFKVPLEKTMVSSFALDDQFTPERLIEMTKELGHELGLVVDLTNTKRYYSSNKEIVQRNIKYSKIYTEGHVVPSLKVRKKFFRTIDEFLQDDTTKDTLIGVHCTHGVNRTGYLVCRYMIDKLGFDPEDAIKAYGDARGYPIERENYIDDLKNGKSTEAEVEEIGSYGENPSRQRHHERSSMHRPYERQSYSRNSQGSWSSGWNDRKGAGPVFDSRNYSRSDYEARGNSGRWNGDFRGRDFSGASSYNSDSHYNYQDSGRVRGGTYQRENGGRRSRDSGGSQWQDYSRGPSSNQRYEYQRSQHSSWRSGIQDQQREQRGQYGDVNDQKQGYQARGYTREDRYANYSNTNAYQRAGWT